MIKNRVLVTVSSLMCLFLGNHQMVSAMEELKLDVQPAEQQQSKAQIAAEAYRSSAAQAKIAAELAKVLRG